MAIASEPLNRRTLDGFERKLPKLHVIPLQGDFLDMQEMGFGPVRSDAPLARSAATEELKNG